MKIKISKVYVFDGYVSSKNDFDKHFISCGKVADLYQIPKNNKNVIFVHKKDVCKYKNILNVHDICLFPDNSGEYILPEYVKYKIYNILNKQ